MALVNAGCFSKLASQLKHREIALKIASFYLQSSETPSLVQIKINTIPLSKNEQIILEFGKYQQKLYFSP